MCRAATCPSCRKTTWKGCGQHVDQVMRNVAAADRCRCTDSSAGTVRQSGGRSAAQPGSRNGGLLSRIFGR